MGYTEPIGGEPKPRPLKSPLTNGLFSFYPILQFLGFQETSRLTCENASWILERPLREGRSLSLRGLPSPIGSIAFAIRRALRLSEPSKARARLIPPTEAKPPLRTALRASQTLREPHLV